jgi:DNA-binding MarR family transcriptional regulator
MAAKMTKTASDPAAAVTFGGLDDLFGFHLRLAGAALQRDFLEAMTPLELTQKQVAFLWLIDANRGVSQIAIAQALGMDRATTMAVIDRLEARGLTLRQRSTVDRRRQELYLTPAGQALLARAKTISRSHERKFVDRMTPEELDIVTRALARIHRAAPPA